MCYAIAEAAKTAMREPSAPSAVPAALDSDDEPLQPALGTVSLPPPRHKQRDSTQRKAMHSDGMQCNRRNWHAANARQRSARQRSAIQINTVQCKYMAVTNSCRGVGCPRPLQPLTCS
eukprot:64904-Pyramimonas_sp.AAC.2